MWNILFEDDTFKGIPKILDIPSGYKPSEPLKLRLIDEEMREITFFDLITHQHIDSNIINEFSQYFLVVESK